jgi:hypothetical protein
MKNRTGLANLLAVASGWLLISVPGSAIASLIEFSHGFAPDYVDIGWGYVKYDRSASFDAYREWWNLWARCDRTNHIEPCSALTDEFEFSLRIKEAGFSDAGDMHMPVPFHVWNLRADRPYCDVGYCVGSTDTHIVIGDELGGTYVNWSCTGDTRSASTFAFTMSRQACSSSFTGSAAFGTEGWDTEHDGYGFSWHRVYMPEPGTLALLGLGLVGMGISRRR